MLNKYSCYKIPFLLVIFLGLCHFTSNGQDISISPVVMRLSGKPGEIINRVIYISNTGKSTYEFQVNMKDWKRDSLGNKLYSDPGTLLHSNANWVSFPETDFKLLPAEKKEFPIYIQIPEKIDPSMSTNSMLFITQINPFEKSTNHKALGIKVSYEFGVQLLYSPEKADVGTILYKNLEHVIDSVTKTSLVKISIQNTGTVHKNGVINVELTNKQTGEEIKLDPLSFAILPLDFQYIYFKIPTALATGEYLLIALLDAGKDTELKVAEKNIHVED